MNQWFDDCDNYGIDSPEWYQPYANEIGRKIREQRKRKGMSQTQLANVMGTDRSIRAAVSNLVLQNYR